MKPFGTWQDYLEKRKKYFAQKKEDEIAAYLRADPIRARRVIRAAKLPQVRVGAKPSKKKIKITEGQENGK